MATARRAGSAGAGRDLLAALLTAILLAVFARAFVVQGVRIPSASMAPGLVPGDHLLVNKLIFDPVAYSPAARLLPVRPLRRGDVVVFKFPAEPRRDFVKRCVGLPGDTVEVRDRRLLVNGRAVDESAYLATAAAAPTRPRDFGPVTVPARQYFCLGDNRDDSDDSRFWGTVPASYVKGRAVVVYWSVATGERESGVARFSAATRWERVGRLVR